MIPTRYIVILSAFLLPGCLAAQGLKGWSFDASYHGGKVIRHSPKIAYEIPDYSQGVIFNARLQTFGRKDWHEWRNFPEVGVALQLFDPGDRETLGYLVGLVPHLNLHLLESGRFSANFQLGSGLAWIDRYYNPISNPLNTAIGSGLNNITVFRLDLNWAFAEKYKLSLGGSFTHMSNAAAATPNLGINIPALSAGIVYTPQPLTEADYSSHGKPKKAEDRWGLTAEFALGFKENNVPGGPKYPIYQAFAGCRYSLSKVNDLQAGLGYEYHRSVYEFALQTFTYTDSAKARKGATRYLFYVADEFRYGRIGIYLFLGVYLNKALAIPSPVPTRLGLRYYFPGMGKDPLRGQMYAGIYLKTHRGVAEYAAFGGGIRF